MKYLQKKLGLAANGIAGQELFQTLQSKKLLMVSNTKSAKNIIRNRTADDEDIISEKEIRYNDDEDRSSIKIKVKKTKRSKVFVSYSHKDKKFLERLEVFIAPLERQGFVNVWSDSRLKAGDLWRKKIQQAMDEAKVAVLLLSADFMASKFITENELPPLIASSKKRGITIILVILSPCILGNLSEYQAVNPPGKTLVDMKKGDRERVWIKVAESLTAALNN